MFNRIIVILFLLCSLSAQAQQKPIRMVVAFGAGGITDILTRKFEEPLEKELGRQLIVDSRPGAGGYIAFKHMANVRSDEVVIAITDSMALSNVILLYDDIDVNNFKYLAQLGTIQGLVLAVRKGSPLKNIDAWRNHRGPPLNVGVNGMGASHHFYSWSMSNQISFPKTDIYYKGTGEMITQLIGGHVDAIWSNLASILQFENTGKLEVVALIANKRIDVLPNTPTFKELGVNLPAKPMFIVIANDTTDTATLREVERAVAKLLSNPEFVKSLSTELQMEPGSGAAARADTERFLQAQAKFVEYVKTLKK
jgi:tripartite-type tricarboxylate transporter receptor subunit TctC